MVQPRRVQVALGGQDASNGTGRDRSPAPFTFLDFFAGSGLVTEGLKPWFRAIFANDNCPKKAAVYTANFGTEHFLEASIETARGSDVPSATLAWGSFPCQDLSLAGAMNGLSRGGRSAVFWDWMRVLKEMGARRRPPVLCAENVVGLLVADGGRQFKAAYEAIRNLGYLAGTLVIDAIHFLPQSRPRSFLVGIREGIPLDGRALRAPAPEPFYHPRSVETAWRAVKDPLWIWWKLPRPRAPRGTLRDIVEDDAPFHPPDVTRGLIAMLSPRNRRKLQAALDGGTPMVGTGYKRIRREDGERKQRLEIRFDGVAGCLRTPEGGSSRQVLLVVRDGSVKTRLLTVRETARLMGVRDSFKLPGSYNGGYKAMGDGVAVPVTRWLARRLLAPLATLATAVLRKEAAHA